MEKKNIEMKTEWKNRIVGSGTENPEDLLANPDNWRIHPDKQQKLLKGVLDDIGWVQDVIVNTKTNHVVDGHLRVMLALRNGEAKIPVKYVDLSQDEEVAILSVFDPIAGLAALDKELYKSLTQKVTSQNAVIMEFLQGEIEKIGGVSTELDLTGAPDLETSEGIEPGTLEKSHVRMVQLFLTEETQPEFLECCAFLEEAFNTDNVTDTVFEAIRYAYKVFGNENYPVE